MPRRSRAPCGRGDARFWRRCCSHLRCSFPCREACGILRAPSSREAAAPPPPPRLSARGRCAPSHRAETLSPAALRVDTLLCPEWHYVPPRQGNVEIERPKHPRRMSPTVVTGSSETTSSPALSQSSKLPVLSLHPADRSHQPYHRRGRSRKDRPPGCQRRSRRRQSRSAHSRRGSLTGAMLRESIKIGYHSEGRHRCAIAKADRSARLGLDAHRDARARPYTPPTPALPPSPSPTASTRLPPISVASNRASWATPTTPRRATVPQPPMRSSAVPATTPPRSTSCATSSPTGGRSASTRSPIAPPADTGPTPSARAMRSRSAASGAKSPVQAPKPSALPPAAAGPTAPPTPRFKTTTLVHPRAQHHTAGRSRHTLR